MVKKQGLITVPVRQRRTTGINTEESINARCNLYHIVMQTAEQQITWD